MTMLGLLIEGAEHAHAKFGPVLAAHREALRAKGREAPDHAAWLGEANLLVVRIHMLSVRGRNTGLDRAIYEGVNAALRKRGREPFEFLNVQGIFDEVRREAEDYGDIVWKRLEAQGVVGGRADFETLEAGSVSARERFARAWLAYKGRSAEEAGLDPRWSEGLKRLTAHVKAQGFGGLVLLVDEYLLWLAEKSGQEFISEINNLNVIVDHNTGQREAPVFVFVARQRNLREFFPDLVDESKIHEHLDHHAKRFEVTTLQDIELRHIVRGRVLRPRHPEAIAEAVASLAVQHEKVLPALLAGGDLAYLKDVYPFHPALIEMLVDVTALMQRERSALRLLYELLVLHNPRLQLGDFIPVGSAFTAVFPESGVEASKRVELMQEVHQEYYMRLKPSMRQLAEASGGELGPERLRALDLMVRTVLLAEVSPRLKQTGGLTIERLVQLNAAEVEGETFRGQVMVSETDLLALSQHVPDLQVAGTGKTAILKYVLGRVSISEYVARARSKMDSMHQRFRVFWVALRKALAIEGQRGFEDAGAQAGEFEVTWRKTRRRGALRLCNVRELTHEDFRETAGTFRVLVDYPWDDPGHTVDEDRQRAQNARKKSGNMYTACWLPRHMTPTELGTLTELAAVRYLLSREGEDDLLAGIPPNDRAQLRDLAATRERALEAQVDELLRKVYIEHGEFHALVPDVDERRPKETLRENLEHIATVLLERRYPQHPRFLTEPKKADLELLLKWMVDAGETHQSVAFDEATSRVLKTLGEPLELVNLGQTKASLRLDTRYVRDVLQHADKDIVAWNTVVEHLRGTYGLEPLLTDLFLCWLCQRDHRALRADGTPAEVRLGMPPSEQVRLQRGELVPAAAWSRLRDLGAALFGEHRPAAHRSLQTQDRFAAAMRKRGAERRTTLQGVHERLVHLGVGPAPGGRLEEVATANARLAPLAQTTTDSHKVLVELLAQWPEDVSDPVRAVVAEADALREALAEVSEHDRQSLQAGLSHAIVGPDVAAHLAGLEARLHGVQAELPLTRAWVKTWNGEAQQLIRRLIEQPRVAAPTGATAATGGGVSATPVSGGKTTSVGPTVVAAGGRPGPVPGGAVGLRLAEARLDAGDPDEVSAFLGRVRKALEAQGPGMIAVALVREGDGA
jgi:hypothetical protein